MTRKEVVDFLEKCRWWFEPFTSEKEQWNEALDIAIEALTQESTQDLISRQAAIKNAHFPMIDDAGYEVVRVDDILALPSATCDDCIWHVCNYNKIDWEGEDGYISRQDALKPFCIAPDGTRIPEVDCDNFPVEFSVEVIKKHLLSLPSAEPKTGEWIKATGMMPPEFHGHHCCSECGAFANMDAPYGNREGLSNYCPNCGAKMYKDGEDE